MQGLTGSDTAATEVRLLGQVEAVRGARLRLRPLLLALSPQ
jgi:hypothetical protein